ncbi:Basic-leucine zipper domain [Sesbania bispinosa]|nr:Basic-leucine zipper domain [Sesbania bispinosa]
MSNNPPGNTSHKRARSEIFTLPKDINIEGDIDTMDGLSLFDVTVEEDLFSVYLNMNKLNPSSRAHDTVVENFAIDIGNTTINERLKVGHQHSQPINGSTSIMKPDIPISTSENGFVIDSRKAMSAGELVERAKVDPKHAESTNFNERLEVGHRHSQSINGSTSTIKPDIPVSASENGSMIASRKVMSAAELVELARVDPKRAERIWANRQSAARSKEKKTRYIFELENKVQKLETEVTSLSTQLTILQRDTQRMATKNDELRLQLQTKRQQLQLQNALKNPSGEEIRHLPLLIGQAMPNGGPMNSVAFGRGQQYSPNTLDTYALLAAQQLQQPQSHS